MRMAPQKKPTCMSMSGASDCISSMSIKFVNALGTKYMMLISASCAGGVGKVVGTRTRTHEHTITWMWHQSIYPSRKSPPSLSPSPHLGERLGFYRVVVEAQALELIEIAVDHACMRARVCMCVSEPSVTAPRHLHPTQAGMK